MIDFAGASGDAAITKAGESIGADGVIRVFWSYVEREMGSVLRYPSHLI